MHNRPVVCFDTSVHNRLMKDGLESEAIYAALQSGYFVRINGISIEELMSATETEVRIRLIASAGRLMDGPYDCLLPQNEILTHLVRAYEANPSQFQWRRVNIQSPEYAAELRRRTLTADDAIAQHVWKELQEAKKQFENMWRELRDQLEEIFQRDGASRPLTFSEVIPRAIGEGGLFWEIAKGLYNRAAVTPATDETIRLFAEACPPFRCVLYALLMTWYDRSMRGYQGGEKFHAGRFDMFMAVYLAYTDQFLSAEVEGEQAKCLAEVARLAGVPTVVLSYDDFCARLMVFA
jgi:hypothetical protein